MTRATSSATAAWSAAKISPKFEETTSNRSSSYGSSSTSQHSKRMSSPCVAARSFADSSSSAVMSTAETVAPARAARIATSPVPVARSSQRTPGAGSSRSTSSSCTGANRFAIRS